MTRESGYTIFVITPSLVSTRVVSTPAVKSEPPSGMVMSCDCHAVITCLSCDSLTHPYSRDGQYIVCGSEDNFIYVWKTHHDFSKLSSSRRDRNECYEMFSGLSVLQISPQIISLSLSLSLSLHSSTCVPGDSSSVCSSTRDHRGRGTKRHWGGHCCRRLSRPHESLCQ